MNSQRQAFAAAATTTTKILSENINQRIIKSRIITTNSVLGFANPRTKTMKLKLLFSIQWNLCSHSKNKEGVLLSIIRSNEQEKKQAKSSQWESAQNSRDPIWFKLNWRYTTNPNTIQSTKEESKVDLVALSGSKPASASASATEHRLRRLAQLSSLLLPLTGNQVIAIRTKSFPQNHKYFFIIFLTIDWLLSYCYSFVLAALCCYSFEISKIEIEIIELW